MITLRRCAPCAVRPPFRHAAAALAFLLACTLALGGRHAAAEAKSRTHHPVGKALSGASFVETSSARVAKKRKGSSYHEPTSAGTHGNSPSRSSKSARGTAGEGNAHGMALRTRTSIPGKRGRARGAEASDDFIPMSRAELRQARRSGRGTSQIATRRFGNPHGRYAHAFAATRAGAPTLAWRSGSRSSSRPQSRPQPRSRVEDDRSDLAYERRTAAQSREAFASPSQLSQPMQGSGYAQGVSRPGDDERLSRTPTGYNDAVIGTAEVDAAPGGRSQAFASANNLRPSGGGLPPQVVSGFGSEVAVMPTDPGATRRRNHPLPASALPGMPPPTLEERDAITEAAVSPAVLPEIYNRDGRLLMPAPLKGSREVLVHQNTMANNDGLERIQDDNELDRLRANRELVSFPTGEDLRVNEALPYNRRYARPWTVLFAGDISHDFFNRFHQPLIVTSAVRTVNYQMRLQRVNGNAAAADGDAASPHLTGQAIDLAKRGMSSAELAWMRAYLLPLMNAGKIDVEEEFQQACFHISVYRRYAVGRRAMQFAQVHSVTPIDNGGSANPPQDAP